MENSVNFLAERCMHHENDCGKDDFCVSLSNENEDELLFNSEQALYDPLELAKFNDELQGLILNLDVPYSEILKVLSHRLKDFFNTRYVEFLTAEFDHLRYEYINVPWFLSYTLNKLTGITAIEGMKVPLFEGSFFKKFIDEAVPRELISYDDRLRSFRDFVSPDNPRNRFLRNVIAPRLMPMFNYNYVFQVPLLNSGKVIGYFSFLQNGRMLPRVRADIILISSRISNLFGIRREIEHRKILLNSFPYPTVKLGIKTDSSGSWVQGYYPAFVNTAFSGTFKIKGGDFLSIDITEIDFFKKHPEHINHFNEVFYTGIPVSYEFELSGNCYKAIVTRLDQFELLITLEDITSQKKADREIREMAAHDPLTGALNRRFFMTILRQELGVMKRENRGCALFFLDLNRFKEVNDTYGHDTGDAVIQHASACLKSVLRDSDYICRQGGDEFIVLCRAANREGAEAIAGKIKKVFNERPVVIGENLYFLSSSVGVSLYPEHAFDAEGLITAADRAMYISKKNSLDYNIFSKMDERSIM